jgi:predicted nucleic acid-binding Zn ribbon protein
MSGAAVGCRPLAASPAPEVAGGGPVRARTVVIRSRWAASPATWRRSAAGRRGWPIPTALRDGVLSVSAESTAWATQLRIIQAQVLAKIAAAVGDGVVTTLKITGPVAPSWRKGPLHIAGRGPRDTYG